MYFKKVSVAEEREYTQLHYVNKKNNSQNKVNGDLVTMARTKIKGFN